MKSKKLKILAPILSVGALATVLIPTITLTSCSATATPYLMEFKSANSNITYNTSASEKITFNTKLDANEFMYDQEITINNDTTSIKFSDFDTKWEELVKKYPNAKLPKSLLQISTPITDQNLINELKPILKNRNIISLFAGIIGNLRNVYENYDALFINKNPDISSLSQKNQFVKYLGSGLNNNKSYARLFLSDISFDLAVTNIPEDGIGTEVQKTETEKSIIAKITNVKLKYQWFWLNDNGSSEVKPEELKDLQALATSENDKPKKLAYEFNSGLTTDVYFKEAFNTVGKADDKNVKYYRTGMIFPDNENPLAFTFRTDAGQEEQNRKKTDFFNKEVKKIKDMKIIEESKLRQCFDELYAKVGYLTTKDLPVDKNNNIDFGNNFNTQPNIKAGQNFIKNLFETKSNGTTN